MIEDISVLLDDMKKLKLIVSNMWSKHMNTKHENAQICEVCGKLFSNNNGLQEQRKKEHKPGYKTLINKTSKSNLDTSFDEADLQRWKKMAAVAAPHVLIFHRCANFCIFHKFYKKKMRFFCAILFFVC